MSEVSTPKKPKPKLHPAMTAEVPGMTPWTQHDDGCWRAEVGIFRLEVTADGARASLDEMPTVKITAEAGGAGWDALQLPDVGLLRSALAVMASATLCARREAKHDADDAGVRAALKRLCSRVAKMSIGGWRGALGRGNVEVHANGGQFLAVLRRTCRHSGSIVDVLRATQPTPAEAIAAMLAGAPQPDARGGVLMADAELAQMREQWAKGEP